MYIFRKLGANFVYGSENQGNTQSKIMIEFDLKEIFFSLYQYYFIYLKRDRIEEKWPIVIYFIFRGILRAAKKLQENDQVSNKTTHKFYWLASDGWGKQSQVVRGIEDFAVGAITVELESKKIPSMRFIICYFFKFWRLFTESTLVLKHI